MYAAEQVNIDEGAFPDKLLGIIVVGYVWLVNPRAYKSGQKGFRIWSKSGQMRGVNRGSAHRERPIPAHLRAWHPAAREG